MSRNLGLIEFSASLAPQSSRKGIRDCHGEATSIQPIAGHSPRDTAVKKNREATVNEVPRQVLILIIRTRQSPENAGMPNLSGS